MRAEQITDPVAYHGEGPVWSARWGGLRWLDILAGDVLALVEGSVTRTHVSAIAAAIRPRVNGGAVIGVERGFAMQDPDGTIHELPALWSEDEGVRMNEGACDPDGRFYCGSMAYDRRPGAGTMHRLDPDGSVHLVLSDLTIANGLDWTPDGRHAYFNDTETYRIDVFDYETSTGLTERRTFVDVSGIGRPDGLTVDADGGVWVALNQAAVVHRYDPAGVLDEVVELPVRKVTACTIGGPDLDELFITTSREGLAPGDEPRAGSLFSVRIDVRGQVTRDFRG